jgi:hypothetical protein
MRERCCLTLSGYWAGIDPFSIEKERDPVPRREGVMRVTMRSSFSSNSPHARRDASSGNADSPSQSQIRALQHLQLISPSLGMAQHVDLDHSQLALPSPLDL